MLKMIKEWLTRVTKLEDFDIDCYSFQRGTTKTDRLKEKESATRFIH
jgi:hypothetical protein